ncbi:unnamed protein product [Candidula unifasciata]|uniref:Uncharacterized protein n=1 Tax=Candidula unifasciata TaxID=100452 RepID=A0A8S3ZFD6_9EUPU|nr:unnamed protein product [Candidula unifasciata]
MAGNQLFDFPPVDDQRDLPPIHPPAPPECLRPGASDNAAVHYQSQNESVLVIPNEGISGKATFANSSEDSCAAYPSDNSRTRLIKPTRQKEIQRQVLPQAPDYVGFNSSFIQAGFAFSFGIFITRVRSY